MADEVKGAPSKDERAIWQLAGEVKEVRKCLELIASEIHDLRLAVNALANKVAGK